MKSSDSIFRKVAYTLFPEKKSIYYSKLSKKWHRLHKAALSSTSCIMIPVTHFNGFCTGLPTVVNSSCHKSSWTFRSSTWKDRWRRKRRLLSKITAVCRWKVQIWTNGYKASREVFENIKTLKRLPLMQPLLFLSCQIFVLINLVCLELEPWPRENCSLGTLSCLPQSVAQFT